MKKSITKKAASRKRPKSVLRKAWETRRKNTAHRALPESEMNRLLYGDKAGPSKLPGIVGLAKVTPTSETETHRSDAAQAGGPNPDYNPQAEIAEIKRDYRTRQLCGFVGDFQIIRRQRSEADATPIMLSWEQARAVHDYLLMEGYSAYGAASAR